ncbi:MAG: alpha/beta hydrolase [Rhodocyclaceae bacterium]|nr:alpha/beta hydrolase [Rhodocyclaceae bacterium]
MLRVVPGGTFSHLTVFKPATGRARADRLHVYLEGDGIPWLTPELPSPDPTPREPLMFDAMRRDPATALYLGRPCHYVGTHEPPCSPLAWTHRRYSPAAVDSLERALRALLVKRNIRQLVFFGHSGGGTLAALLAPRFDQSRAVVTLAANLDVAAWARTRGFSPLDGSLDPATQPALSHRLLQWHLVGERDTTVPPDVTRRYAEGQSAATITSYPSFDHRCCWLDLWPELPAAVDAALDAAPRVVR